MWNCLSRGTAFQCRTAFSLPMPFTAKPPLNAEQSLGAELPFDSVADKHCTGALAELFLHKILPILKTMVDEVF